MKKICLLLCFLSMTSTVFAGPHKDTRILKDVELKWTPTDDINDLKKIDFGFLDGKTIKIEKFKDARKADMKNKVGENVESDKFSLPVLTNSDVADFVTENVAKVLSKAGVDIVDSGKADYVLSGEIKEYFVEEKDNYLGVLSARMKLSKGGIEVWSGKVSGTNKRFGRSYKLDNYMESLSDSIVDFSKELLSSKTLSNRLSK
jgi:hypothetical protein